MIKTLLPIGIALLSSFGPAFVAAPAQSSHWSFQPLQGTTPPSVRNESWPLGPIDDFILSKLEQKGLSPAARADKRTLIRRLSFNLIGLPPTPEEIDAFVNDATPEAYEKLIERLLASPHYGERWGRHWLDVVRYSDSAGDSSDYPIPQAYKYRNYVIAAFNSDKPYDQFIREQIAGDLLPARNHSERVEKVVATGYLALARRFSVNPESVQHLTIEDAIDNLGKAVLGLSIGCARCHDHKYDPIPTEDYYGLYGIFGSTRFPFAGSENEKRQRGLVPLLPEHEVEQLMKPLQTELAPIEAEIKRLEEELAESRQRTQNTETQETASTARTARGRTITELREAIREARRKRDAVSGKAPPIESAFAVSEGTAKNARVHLRGEPGRQGDEVPRHFLAVLGGHALASSETGSGRLELAEWLVDPNNPLTARVLVNRIWQFHFGKGLVQTPNDFGIRGRPPEHPELLDFLARRLIENGWSIKQLHRSILLSQTYQQASRNEANDTTIDPNNDLLWRFDRRRLDAESTRDAILFVSGTLENSMDGKHPFPGADRWTFTQHAPFNAVYDSKLRSVYLMQQRIKKHPFLELFDGADPNSSTAVRLVNTTPLQSLYFLNDRFIHEQANQFASRIAALEVSHAQQIDRAFQITYGRHATEAEIAETEHYLSAYRGELSSRGLADTESRFGSWASLARVLFSSNEFLFVD